MNRVLPLLGTGLLLTALLGSGTLLLGRMDQDPVSMPDVSRETEQAAPATGGDTGRPPRPAEYYAAISERPLFTPTRRPVTGEPALAAPVLRRQPAAAPPPPPFPEVRMMGTIGSGDRHRALLSVNDGTPEWHDLGSVLAGWRLAAIGPDWIELERDDATRRLEMYP